MYGRIKGEWVMSEVLKQLCTLYAINGNSGCWDKDTKTRGKPCDCEVSRTEKLTIAVRDKWWIDRVGEDIVEVFLNFPMNDANKETLLKTWQRLKKESEIK
jgi:hypothetical protein